MVVMVLTVIAWAGGEFDHAAAEVWTLGILLYTMMVGTSPFNSATDAVNGRFRIPRHLSTEAYVQRRRHTGTRPVMRSSCLTLAEGCGRTQGVHHSHVLAAQPAGSRFRVIAPQAPVATTAIGDTLFSFSLGHLPPLFFLRPLRWSLCMMDRQKTMPFVRMQ